MEVLSVKNPFMVGKYIPDEYFCDREKETEFLIKQIENERNVALISPRRMGKTGLIHHCFNRVAIKDNYYTFFVDIYATGSLNEFVYAFSKAVYDELKPGKESWKKRFFNIIRSLRVGFRVDSLSGEPVFDIGLGDIKAPETTLDEIFEYLEGLDKPCVIAIDEFQQITTYPEGNVEALLRTKIQHSMNSQFVFAGSKRHMMSNMFHSSSKPFYQSAIITGLDPIPLDMYKDFASRLFEERGKCVDGSVVEYIYNRYEGCTWFVQMMMNELFALTDYNQTCTEELIPMAWENVVQSQSDSYRSQLSQLSSRQKAVLQAIAREGKVKEITSADFVNRYSLLSSSSVQSAVKALLKNDVVTFEDDTYRIYDYFFAEWLRKEF